ncbi:hypothetical protein OTK49_03245 [Vibrio coralliirubri]|uniref:hypothetical protein n=1 Tax=Vibrio coralliirubri TaxID=1516159 RepID=UPI002284DE89|nr:hypothetical protein [Vibrio coralliirubri]MCY9861532.1 hypothetical protein [Vibrio coralliirubri]
MKINNELNYNLCTDYKQLFSRVCSGEIIAGFVDYTSIDVNKVYRDICKIRLNDDSIEATVRGVCYMSVSDFDMVLCKGKLTLEEIFIKDCEKLNLGWIVPEHTTSTPNESKLRATVNTILQGDSLSANDRVKLMEALK